ncbi:MAG: hypothetical protein ABIK09_09715, partial [Pseudomonadota bacterium]
MRFAVEHGNISSRYSREGGARIREPALAVMAGQSEYLIEIFLQPACPGSPVCGTELPVGRSLEVT